MKHIIFICFAFCASFANAQLSVSTVNAQIAAQQLVGPGITILNPTFTGYPDQLGLFSNGSIMGVTDGVVITTGDVQFAGSTQTSNDGDEAPIVPGTTTNNPDSDLAQLGSHFPSLIKDAGVLEFDFIPTGNIIEFKYVFASEEYLNYSPHTCPDIDGNTCEIGPYNDLFGFFVSGPGISGTFSNNSENIAIVPSTTSYVGVSTINMCFNPSFFNDNDCTVSRPICLADCVHPNHPFYPFPYDGFTDVLNAQKIIQCVPGETYHIKLAIANVADKFMDAAVFIKANSFQSNFDIGPIAANPSVVCEGSPLNLTVTGNNNYTYTWSDGQTGVGLTTITTPSNLNTNQYTVTATNASGCQTSETITVNVHPQENDPPIINGINNTGVYNVYVNAEDQICFDVPSFDDLNENVNIFLINASFNGYSFTETGNQQTGHFCWSTTELDIGQHTFTIRVCDENACEIICSEYLFYLNVICKTCPVDIYYENRNISGLPLPEVTRAGRSIIAGTSVDPAQTNGPVLVSPGEAVDFRAGLSVQLFPGFHALSGSSFQAIIDPGTCTDDCENCCETWEGFTLDAIPNVITPNGDGINEIWYVPDVDNPFCAFNAQGYDLEIFDRWGVSVWHQQHSGGCC